MNDQSQAVVGTEEFFENLDRESSRTTGGSSEAAPKKTPSLMRVLPKLQWTLLKRSFHKNWAKIIGLGFALLYGIGALVFFTIFMAGLLFVPAESGVFALMIRAVGLGAVVVWTLQSLFLFGVDDTLSPARFAQFGRGPKELLKPILVSSLISVGFIFTALAALVTVVLEAIWLIGALVSNNGAAISTTGAIIALIALVPMTALGLLLCVLIPRAIFAWTSTIRIAKRKKERLQALLLIAFLVIVYGANLLLNSGGGIMDGLARLAGPVYEFLLWTPFGAPFSVPMDLAEGLWLAALIRFVLTLATIWLLWQWWGLSFAEGQLQALKGASQEQDAKVKPLVPSFLKPNALGASAGRSLKYWRRDTRYSTALIIAPILAVFMLAMSVVVNDNAFMAYFAVAIVAWLAGITISNEIGFDGPSSWVNIVAGMDNRANLLGRYVALGVLMLPLVVIVAIAAPLLQSQPQFIALTLPAALGFVASSWGISLLTTAFLPMPAPKPGTMKNSRNGGGSGQMWITFLATFVGTWLPLAPSIILIVVGLKVVPGLEYAGAVLALVIGGVTLYLGQRFAVKHLDSHYADEFQKVRAFAG
ncbi:hypothetical protein [Dermabacter vaginalis]|uniref:ABC transporter permease n=1 Tax=Dermabacter vaginalis TaxID=1630135 RepID=A0ABX6A5B3_9MICO|nr:hypothetical protein [Dermabacter vaginalis]QEU12340.1 hypothetical protein FOB48_08505 [Dermabacter vaginalis]